MDFEVYSYRFAKEIIEHESHQEAFNEIIEVVRNCPLFTWPGKSDKNPNLDVIQQLTNAYFDIQFHNLCDWEYHPAATEIPGSRLKTDFRKTFGALTIQTEVQFGNMARWYSDIFKFQTAYSQEMIKMGLCIIPFHDLGRRIDSNVTNFERCIREIQSAEMSITLPILFIGLKVDDQTSVVNVSDSAFANLKDVIGKGKSDNLYRIVNACLDGQAIETVSENTPIGNRP